jgi:hypothetical protein
LTHHLRPAQGSFKKPRPVLVPVRQFLEREGYQLLLPHKIDAMVAGNAKKPGTERIIRGVAPKCRNALANAPMVKSYASLASRTIFSTTCYTGVRYFCSIFSYAFARPSKAAFVIFESACARADLSQLRELRNWLA